MYPSASVLLIRRAMTEPCAGCAAHTANFVDLPTGRRMHVCNADCLRVTQRPAKLPQPTASERRTAEPLPAAQRAALLPNVPESVRVMAYVPSRPSVSQPIAADNGTIYLQAHRLPDGTLVVDRFDNYTTPGHSWRATLVRAVPQRSAPQAVHAVPPAPAAAPPPTPALTLSAPIAVQAVVVPGAEAVTCGHRTTLALAWPGTASRPSAQFCGAKCAERHIGQPVRVVADVGAELLAQATGTTWLQLPADSPLLRVYRLHPRTQPVDPTTMHVSLARVAADALAHRPPSAASIGGPIFGEDDNDDPMWSPPHTLSITEFDEPEPPTPLYPASQQVSPSSPSRAPPTPLYPASAAASPSSPTYGPPASSSSSAAAYQPSSPTWTTSTPDYAPASPSYSPSSPTFPAVSPSYTDAARAMRRAAKRGGDDAGGQRKRMAEDPLVALPPWALRYAIAAADAAAGRRVDAFYEKADTKTRTFARQWWNDASVDKRRAFAMDLQRDGRGAGLDVNSDL